MALLFAGLGKGGCVAVTTIPNMVIRSPVQTNVDWPEWFPGRHILNLTERLALRFRRACQGRYTRAHHKAKMATIAGNVRNMIRLESGVLSLLP